MRSARLAPFLVVCAAYAAAMMAPTVPAARAVGPNSVLVDLVRSWCTGDCTYLAQPGPPHEVLLYSTSGSAAMRIPAGGYVDGYGAPRRYVSWYLWDGREVAWGEGPATLSRVHWMLIRTTTYEPRAFHHAISEPSPFARQVLSWCQGDCYVTQPGSKDEALLFAAPGATIDIPPRGYVGGSGRTWNVIVWYSWDGLGPVTFGHGATSAGVRWMLLSLV